MKKRLLSTLLALCMVLTLLPATTQAAESDLPDWYFLFAIFKSVDADCMDMNGVVTHMTYTMTQEEVDIAHSNAKAFEAYMDNVWVMHAHVDVIEIDTPVTKLYNGYAAGSILGPNEAAPFLEDRVDLDKYDTNL